MESKKAYQEKMEAQLKEWSARIDLLKAKADKAKAEAKTSIMKRRVARRTGNGSAKLRN
jgi:hypothetical protein